MKKERIIISLLVLLLSISACTRQKEDNTVVFDERIMTMMTYYARDMGLQGESGLIRSILETRDYSSIAFVVDLEEQDKVEESILFLWPSEKTYDILAAINRVVIRSEIDVTLFLLEYPITIENVINDWENVHHLWFGERDGGISRVQRSQILLSEGEWPPIDEELE